MKIIARKVGTLCVVLLAVSALVLSGCSNDPDDPKDSQNTEQTGILDDVLLNSSLDWNNALPLISNDGKTVYTVEFKAKGPSIDFKLANKDYSLAYSLDASGAKAERIAADDEEAAFYKGNCDGNLTLGGLVAGVTYRMTVVPSEDGAYVTVSVTNITDIPDVIPWPDLTGWEIKSNANDDSWSEPYANLVPASEENVYTAEITPFSDTLAFGFLDADGSWVCGGGFSFSASKGAGDGSVSAGDESRITGLNAGAAYVLTLTVKDADGNATIAILEK